MNTFLLGWGESSIPKSTSLGSFDSNTRSAEPEQLGSGWVQPESISGVGSSATASSCTQWNAGVSDSTGVESTGNAGWTTGGTVSWGNQESHQKDWDR